MHVRLPAGRQSRPTRRRAGSLRTKAALITALPALALLAVFAAMLAVEHEAARHEQVVDGSIAIDRAAARVLALVVDAETGVRGYVATGDAQFLQPEFAARLALPDALNHLEALLDQQPGTEPVGDLRATIASDLNELQALKELGILAPDRAKQVILREREGKRLTDAVRADIAALQSYEQALHDKGDAARERSATRTHRLALTVALLGLIGGIGGAALLMSRLIRGLRHLERNAALLAAGEPLLRGDNLGSREVASLAAALDDAALLIRSQRERLQLALDVGRINVWEVDPAGRLTMHGDRSHSYGETLEDGLATLLAEHAELLRGSVDGVRQDGKPRDFEVQSERDRRWITGRLMQSGADVIGVSVDVTALRQAQDELRSSEVRRGLDALAASERRGRYNALVIGSAGEGIISIDGTGRCISANPSAARMLGYETPQIVGQDLHELCHHSYQDGSPYPAAECRLLRAATAGTPTRVEDEVFWRRDGSRLPVAYSVSPLTDDGLMRGAVITFTDVSARRGADEELEREAAALRLGIRNGELVLHFQPKVDIATGRCESVEALVRWQRDDRLVYPDEFIAVAERGGVIGELTGWVVDGAAQQVAAWRADGVDLGVAVNLSALSLTDSHMVRALAAAADRHRIPVSKLEIEITESAAAENPETVIAVLAELSAMKVKTAIDDFGTGFSSLSYLKHLPVGALKIDKSFVMNMPTDPRDQAIVTSTIHMAHSLGMSVVAEGVESEAVLGLLRDAGCDSGQGYHWSRPLPAVELAAWWHRRA